MVLSSIMLRLYLHIKIYSGRSLENRRKTVAVIPGEIRVVTVRMKRTGTIESYLGEKISRT